MNVNETIEGLKALNFEAVTKQERTEYSEQELMFMENNKRANYINDKKATPQELFINPEHNIFVEVFINHEGVQQMNAIFKHSNIKPKQDEIAQSFANLNIEQQHSNEAGSTIENIKKVNLNSLEDLKTIVHAYQSPFVYEEKIKFDQMELNYFSFMGHQQTPVLMNQKLNQMLSSYVDKGIGYPKGFKGRIEPQNDIQRNHQNKPFNNR